MNLFKFKHLKPFLLFAFLFSIIINTNGQNQLRSWYLPDNILDMSDNYSITSVNQNDFISSGSLYTPTNSIYNNIGEIEFFIDKYDFTIFNKDSYIVDNILNYVSNPSAHGEMPIIPVPGSSCREYYIILDEHYIKFSLDNASPVNSNLKGKIVGHGALKLLPCDDHPSHPITFCYKAVSKLTTIDNKPGYHLFLTTCNGLYKYDVTEQGIVEDQNFNGSSYFISCMQPTNFFGEMELHEYDDGTAKLAYSCGTDNEEHIYIYII